MKFLIAILFPFYLSAQDTLFWVGTNHPDYVVQRSYDSYIWNTIGKVKGNHDSNYYYPIVGPTYYYRVYADNDTSSWLLAYETLGITTDSIIHPVKKKDSFDFKVWQNVELQVQITSERYQQATITITGMLGNTIERKTVTLNKGSNITTLKAPMTGIYAISVQTYFDYLTKKIFVR